MAYALLLGLPPEVDLYASTVPLIGYALFGASRQLAAGPVAIVSVVTAAALGGLRPNVELPRRGPGLHTRHDDLPER